MDHKKDRPDVWEIALGFMDSQVLLTAEELGLFPAMDIHPRSLEEVSARAGIPVRSAERILSVLCALRLVRRLPEGKFVNSREASEKLVPGKPGYIGGMFRHLREELYPMWGHLKEALATGKRPHWQEVFDSPPERKMYTDPDSLRAFMEGMHAVSYPAAVEFAARAKELEEVRTIVDVGGATGAFLIAVAERFPAVRGIVFDLPPVRPIAEEYIGRNGLADRLSFAGGDFFADPLPAGADAYSLGFVLHDWGEEEGSHILEEISKAVRPGGLLIVGEYVFNDEKTGPIFVARSDLNMLVAAKGRERTMSEYREWIERFGFRLERSDYTERGKSFLVARKTAADHTEFLIAPPSRAGSRYADTWPQDGRMRGLRIGAGAARCSSPLPSAPA
jgi:predicted O-methyltransferase YrrM